MTCRCKTSRSTSAACVRCGISASRHAPARSPASSARTAPAKARRSMLICGFYRPDAGTVRLGDGRVGASRLSDSARRHRAHLSDQPAVRDDVGDRQRADCAAARPARRRLFSLAANGRCRERRDRRKPARLRRLYRRARSAGGCAAACRQAAGRNRPRARGPSGVLALDEPAAGLDAEDTAAIGALLRKLAARA